MEDRASSPSLAGGSRPGTPYLSEASQFSPHGVGSDDSFFHFMSRMVHDYVREEEVKAHHQATLLQLREKALKDKTKVCGLGVEGGRGPSTMCVCHSGKGVWEVMGRHQGRSVD